MKINNKYYKGIWRDEKNGEINIIDQRKLPFEFVIEKITTVDECVFAIKEMIVRGAPLIGVTAAWGMYLATIEAKQNDNFDEHLKKSVKKLKSSRPTAVDLFKAIDKQIVEISKCKNPEEKIKIAEQIAREISDETVAFCKKIGEYGFEIIKKISESKNGEAVNILTHCNAGWLATVDYGTATAPIYLAHDKGIKVHVWVDETRPRNQGASLTAFELGEHGVPYSVIADNTGGHLMQHKMVDLVIVGTDRTTRTGDVANKIGTYLKALAAFDNNIPFYVAAPSSSIDFKIKNGLTEIPIEKRNEDEVKYISGLHENKIKKILLTPQNSKAVNYSFDVTPARFVTALITERGICKANEKGILELFQENK
ncbi:MAG: S-methyl-5-thioribose-1-phosphate isomerase [Bacteroidota bacterium]|nr:S-methyl-5-thioribose-1-phosphate isomerase [Bacteroidota bacterium]